MMKILKNQLFNTRKKKAEERPRSNKMGRQDQWFKRQSKGT
jgi:hypothetical protein